MYAHFDFDTVGKTVHQIHFKLGKNRLVFKSSDMRPHYGVIAYVMSHRVWHTWTSVLANSVFAGVVPVVQEQ